MGQEKQMNGNIPMLEWFDESYLKKVLIEYEGKSIELKHFTKQLATNKGENYASAMHLINVEYSTGSDANDIKFISMIVKSRLDNEFLSEIEEEFNVFEREAQIYKCIMTSCEKSLQSIGYYTKFGPRALYVDDRVIIQENLKEQGYGIQDIKKGLEFDDCKMVLQKLAAFHASSMILYEKNPYMFKHHMKGNISENPSPLHDLYKNSWDTCLEYIATVPELKQYLDKLENYKKDIIPKLIRIFSRNSTEIHILNHGDLWVNNMMFKKDKSGNSLDILLVDYQEGYFGSPGIDLNYFMYTSFSKDVYINHKEDLIQEYYKTLVDILTKFKYEKQLPTLEDIKREIRIKGDHGLITAICLYPILIGDYPEYADPVTFISDTEEAKKNRFTVFNNKRYGDYLKLILKDFVSQVCSILQ